MTRKENAFARKMAANEIWYTCRDRFDPSLGWRWDEYVQWSGLSQLSVLMSLDNMLCRQVIETLTDEDWLHNIQANYLIFFFRDFDYLR